MPYVSNSPKKYVGTSVGSGQWVAFVQAAAQTGLTRSWKRGEQVPGTTLAIGTAIATFDDSGKYINDTHGKPHAAIYLGQNETTMSSSRAVLAGMLLAAAFSAGAADEIACPQRHTFGGKTGYLDSADVFEGSPEKLASPMPDLETSEWQLEVEQQTARRTGESLYLVCRYKGINDVVQLKLPYAAAFCKVEGGRQGADASCRPARSSAGRPHRP